MSEGQQYYGSRTYAMGETKEGELYKGISGMEGLRILSISALGMSTQ